MISNVRGSSAPATTCTTNSSLNPTASPFNPNHQPQDPNFKICTFNARSHFKNEPQNNHTSISLIHLNARSLLPKMTEVRHSALQRRPDIIAVSETWLSPLVPSGAVDIPTYSTCARSHRPSGRRGGGTLLYVTTELHTKERCDLISWPESAWMEIHTSPHPTIIGCLYKPPNSCPSIFATALESSLFRVDPEHNIVIVGDVNATCPSWCSTDSYNEALNLFCQP